MGLAARLVGAAAPGRDVDLDDVDRALLGRVVSEAQGEVRFKGIAEPVGICAFTASPASRSGP